MSILSKRASLLKPFCLLFVPFVSSCVHTHLNLCVFAILYSYHSCVKKNKIKNYSNSKVLHISAYKIWSLKRLKMRQIHIQINNSIHYISHSVITQCHRLYKSEPAVCEKLSPLHPYTSTGIKKVQFIKRTWIKDHQHQPMWPLHSPCDHYTWTV